MRPTLIPTSWAAVRLQAQARIALPNKVWLKKRWTPRTSTAVPPMTQRFCGSRVTSPSRMGVSPEKAGRAWMSLPHSSRARPRRKMEAPMVMMMAPTTVMPLAGAMAKRCSIRPTTRVSRTAPRMAAGSGRPLPADRAMAPMAPSITNSPWARFTTSEAL